jgi:hypothetical protein
VNERIVGAQGDLIVIGRPTHRLTKREALNLAAWLVLLAETDDGEFAKVLEEERS